MRILKLFGIAGVIALLMACIASPQEANARKIKTKHTVSKKIGEGNKTLSKDSSRIVLTADSAVFIEKIKPAIRFYGFDKTVGSNQESFFISNGLDTPVEGMVIEITYFDMKGRQLHKRQVTLDCTVPAGETLRKDIKSWDTQKSFYFHQSAKPKRQATPFDAKIDLLSLTLPSLPSEI